MLSDSTVILKLTIRSFRATKKDRKATGEVARERSAEVGRIALVKRLLPDDVFSAVYAHDEETYNTFNSLTVPWADGSEEADTSEPGKVVPIGRLCRSSVFPEVMEQIQARKRTREPLVETALQRYAEVVANPDKLQAALGSLYNPMDYPDAERVAKKFALELRVFPVPASDWRIQLADEHASQLKALADQQQAEAARQARAHLCMEIAEPLRKVLRMLTKPDGKRAIRSDTLANLADIARRITALNVTDDPAFEVIRSEILADVASFAPETLRRHAGRRAEAAQAADAILNKLGGILGAPVPSPLAPAEDDPPSVPDDDPVNPIDDDPAGGPDDTFAADAEPEAPQAPVFDPLAFDEPPTPAKVIAPVFAEPATVPVNRLARLAALAATK